MNLLARISFAKIKNEKSRLWLTVAGVALSTAMLLAVLLGSDAALDVMRRYTICQQGEWFYSVLQLPASVAQALIDESGANETVGAYGGMIRAADRDGAPITLYGTSGTFLEMMQTELAEGRWPASQEEIIVRQDSTGWQVGDRIEIAESGGTDRQLTIVGTYTRSVLDLQIPPEEGAVTAFYGIDWASPRGEDLYRFFSMPTPYTDAYAARAAKAADAAIAAAPEAYTLYNNSLITCSGIPSPGGQNLVTALVLTLRVILLAGVAFAAVLLLTNTFSISLARQKRQLALLVSIGATTRQAGCCLLYEALFIGVAGIPLGILLGYAGLFAVFRLLDPLTQNAGAMLGGDLSFRIGFDLLWTLTAAALSALVLFVSARRPIRTFRKQSVIANLYGSGEVEVSCRVTRQGRMAARILGPEAGLAVKEARRRWRSYKSAVRSLAACMILFIGAAGLGVYLPASWFATQSVPAGVITVDYAAARENLPETELFQRLTQPETLIERATVTEKELFDTGVIPAAAYTEQSRALLALLQAAQEGAGYSAAIEFELVPDEVFEELAGPVQAPAGAVGCILENRFFYGTEEITQTCLRTGDRLETSLGGMPVSLYLAGVDQKRYVGHRVGDLARLSVLIRASDAETLFTRRQQMTGEAYPRVVSIAYETDRPRQLQNELAPYSFNELFITGSADYLVVTDNSVERMLVGIARILFGLICYGFSGLLALISICHMVATLSTGFALQQRDLALFRLVGAGESSVQKMILLQAAFCLLDALKWAVPLGVALLLGEYALLRRVAGFRFVVPWWAFGALLSGSLLVTVLAALPAIRASRGFSIVEGNRVNE